ncbi:MAG: exodeoxyribonuclease VII large subunit [Chitinophagaceae bacterium]
MNQTSSEKTILSLYDTLRIVKQTLEEKFPGTWWIRAEMNKLNFYRQSGHCYPELVEKSNGKVIAQIRSNLWRDDYQRINRLFLSTINEPLKEGIKVLLLAKISFDPVYGLALRILDMDPAYTLGDLEAEKQNSIRLLKADGLFDRNKLHTLALVPNRIAIVSDSTSKGYADFMRVLNENQYGYRFHTILFPSLLQGTGAVSAIINQLKRIYKVRHHFDAVAIVRGGGGDVGLSCYNDHALSTAIARFPLPVLTGIGHSTNETVAEMVAHTNCITPTQLGEVLVRQVNAFAEPVLAAENFIGQKTLSLLKEKKLALDNISRLLHSAVHKGTSIYAAAVRLKQTTLVLYSKRLLEKEQEKLNRNRERMAHTPLKILRTHTVELTHLESNIHLLSPEQILKRGYSITLYEGHAVLDGAKLQPGSKLTTRLHNGIIESAVISHFENQTNE